MDFLAFAFGGLFLLLASLHDLKTREVPDMLSYGLIFFALSFRLAETLITNNWTPLLSSLVGASVMFIIGLILFYAGQWGGADSKLLVGMGALLGLGFGTWDAALFLLLVLIAGAFYGIIYSIGLAIIHRKNFMSRFKQNLRAHARLRRIVVLICLLLIILVVILSPAYKILLGTLAVMAYLTFNLWLVVRSVEQSILIKRYPVEKLTEGDWINEEVIVNGKKLAGPDDLGVTKKQIAKIKNAGVKEVIVKEGIPFVPSFLLASILLWLFAESVRTAVLNVL